MFCPQCSHAQTSENNRFCSRCGFQLNEVAELISNAGKLRTPVQKSQRNQTRLKQTVYRIGEKLIFLSLTILPYIFILSYIFDSPVPFLIPLLIFFAGLAQVSYTRLFSKRIFDDEKEENSSNYLEKQSLRLLSLVENPIRNFNFSQTNSEEIITPPSVTENTTKLLEINDE